MCFEFRLILPLKLRLQSLQKSEEKYPPKSGKVKDLCTSGLDFCRRAPASCSVFLQDNKSVICKESRAYRSKTSLLLPCCFPFSLWLFGPCSFSLEKNSRGEILNSYPSFRMRLTSSPPILYPAILQSEGVVSLKSLLFSSCGN